MTRWKIVIAVAAVLLMNVSLIAQGKGGGSKSQAGKSQSSKTTHASKTTQPSKGTQRAQKQKTSKSGTTTASSTTNTETTTPATNTGTTLSPAQQKLQRNTNLASKLQSRLPQGTDLMKAAAGFKNLGQFVAAVNVSNNLDIPFRKLRSAMIDDNLSLGQAIQSLKPSANATTETLRAEQQANTLIAESEVASTSSTSTTTTSKAKKTKPSSSGGGLR